MIAYTEGIILFKDTLTGIGRPSGILYQLSDVTVQILVGADSFLTGIAHYFHFCIVNDQHISYIRDRTTRGPRKINRNQSIKMICI